MKDSNAGPYRKLVWTYSTPPAAAGHYLTSIFRDWHRAHLLGCQVLSFEFGGHKKTALELERLNLWIAGYGAWRASVLPYWEAREILDGVFVGRSHEAKVGCAGGGRSSSRAKLEKALVDGSDGADGVALFKIAEFGDEQSG